MKRVILILFFSSFWANMNAQESINGFWKGALVMAPGGCFPVYQIEFHLQLIGKKIRGTSFHYSDTTNFVREEFEGAYDESTKKLTIQEKQITLFHVPPDCVPCIKKYELTFHTNGKDNQLRGSWTGHMYDTASECPSGTIVLNRTDKVSFKSAIAKELIERNNDVTKEIYINTDSLKLDFFDNGQIDGDSITVYVNNKPVITHQMLKASPLTTHIVFDKNNRELDVIMVGDNLGSIPPNTALMRATSGNERYEIRLSSDMKKNGSVRFIRR